MAVKGDTAVMTMWSGRANAADVNPERPGRLGRANAVALDSEGWLDLLWPGEWQHPDGPQVAEAKDIELTLANLQDAAKRAGADWAGIPVYIGHPEMDGTLVQAPARAWIKQFRINGQTGRLQGMPEWCDGAKAELIDSRSYKYLSCYEWGDVDAATSLFHPAYISSVGLTNSPVKRAGQKPLANADGGAAEAPENVTASAETGVLVAQIAELQARCNALAGEVQELRGQAAARVQAADPLAGAQRPQRANAINDPAGVPQIAAAVVDGIRARANALLKECGGNWDRAWHRACSEARQAGGGSR